MVLFNGGNLPKSSVALQQHSKNGFIGFPDIPEGSLEFDFLTCHSQFDRVVLLVDQFFLHKLSVFYSLGLKYDPIFLLEIFVVLSLFPI